MTEPFYAPRFAIRLSGISLAADLTQQVVSLTIETDLDMAGTFALVLSNPDNVLLDSALLDIGKTAEIHIGYGAGLVPAFLGEVASVEPSFPSDGPPTIQVTGYDKSFRLRRNQPKATTHTLTTDSLIAAQIAVENGLIPMIDPTPELPQDIPQTDSDFAFLKSRAQRYFFDVYVEWDRLHFQFPRPQPVAYVLEWGRNLSSFSGRIAGAGLAGLQVIRGYNQELAQTIYAAALAVDFDVDNLVERLGSGAMDMLASFVREEIRHPQVSDQLSAVGVAKSLLADLLEGMYEGQGTCVGLPDLTAGKYIEVRGVGKRFSGTYRVRKVTHRIDSGGFRTDFAITQQGGTSFLSLLRKHVKDMPAPHRAEPFYGVVVAQVEENNELAAIPPEVPLGRVKVSYPGLSDALVSDWAPCARPAAGDGSGFYALPDKGDQVLVAFEGGDFAKPYVLGSLWNAKRQPPETNADGRNARRVFASPLGHTITFDDGTPARVTVRDAGGSEIVMDSGTGAVTISAAGSLTIKAATTLQLEAAGGTTKLAMDATSVVVT